MANTFSKEKKLASKQLSFYSSRRYVPDGIPYIASLYPFWGKNIEDLSNPSNYRYDRYIEGSSLSLRMDDLVKAQIGILPFDWTYVVENHPHALAMAQEMAKETARHGIPLAVFYLNDSIAPVNLDNSVTFRTSGNRSSLQENETIIPAWSEDFVERYCQGQLPLRTKSSKPTVGYCGYNALVRPRNQVINQIRLQLGAIPKVTQTLSKVGFELVKHSLPWLYGSRIRSQALFILSKAPLVQCNFLIQDRLHHTEKLTLDQRKKFVTNMLDSDYVLCTRGGGNFSYRFYETLSCGRIPVFINTDCALPFERWIDWKKFCIWVEEDDLPYLGDRICEFHNRLTPQQFQELQLNCRKLWLEWLSPQGFHANFYRYFEDRDLKNLD
jgi:Exostosin family